MERIKSVFDIPARKRALISLQLKYEDIRSLNERVKAGKGDANELRYRMNDFKQSLIERIDRFQFTADELNERGIKVRFNG
jgi:hypothetical protein